MLFNSLEFLLFFPLVTVLYFRLPLRQRHWLLVIASTVFYMAFIPAYVLILYGTIVVDYFAGQKIEASTGRARKWWLAASIVANVGTLAVFKYCNFTIANLNTVLALFHSSTRLSLLEVSLPVGLSFHTFQAMSYTIEIYRGTHRAERSFLVYALYVMFYPQLVAGPIERPQNVIPQLKVLHPFEATRVVRGFRRMLWGYFKKAVVADRLAVLVAAAYSAPGRHSGPALAIATVAFAFQIYADFSGYSDIALGTAEVMGVRLMTNFRQPYVSQSVSEFWSRWHISLSTWFRDYLYIPLGGNRQGPIRSRLNLLITFLVSGLWHGANWTYVAWGGLNGLMLVFEKRVRPRVQKRARDEGTTGFIRVGVTFALICLTWIFFRAASIEDALLILRRLPTGFTALGHPRALIAELGTTTSFAIAVVATGLLVVADVLAARRDIDSVELLEQLPSRPRWALYFGVTGALVFLGLYGHQQFIYFQF